MAGINQGALARDLQKCLGDFTAEVLDDQQVVIRGFVENETVVVATDGGNALQENLPFFYTNETLQSGDVVRYMLGMYVISSEEIINGLRKYKLVRKEND